MKELNLEYKVYGEGNSTVVIELGIGCSLYDWYPLVQNIKKNFRVILYHRAGYGKSAKPTNARTTKNIAKELNYLLKQIGVTEEVTLIGHSFGGLCAQQYAKMYPYQIKRLVLIDSTSPDYKRLYDLDLPVMYSLISLEKMINSNIIFSKKSKEELLLSNQNIVKEQEKRLPQDMLEGFKEFVSSPLLFKTIAEEFSNWGNSGESIKRMDEIPNIPLFVIARDKVVSTKAFMQHGIPEKEAVLYEEVWRELQDELSQLSSNGKLIIARQSDHEIHKDRPDIIIDLLGKL